MIHKRNRNVFYIIRFCTSLVFFMPIWVAYFEQYLTASEIALVIAIQFIAQTLIEIPSGGIADLLGRKLTSGIGFLIGASSMLLIPFASTFAHFVVIYILLGVMDAFISGSEEALLYDSLKQDGIEESFSEAYSSAYIILQSGLLIGAFTGGFLYQISPTLPYTAWAVMLIISFVASLFYIEPEIDSEKFSLSTYKAQLSTGIKQLYSSNEIKQLSLLFILIGGITWSSQSLFNTSLLTEVIENDSVRGIVQAVIRLVNIGIVAWLFRGNQILKTTQKLLVLPLLMIVAYLPGFFVGSSIGALFVYFASTASTLRWLVMAEVMNPLFESKYRATAISAMSMGISLVVILIYLISGPILDRYGIGLMYTLLGIFSVVCILPMTFNNLVNIKGNK